jgi:hypothetical protein
MNYLRYQATLKPLEIVAPQWLQALLPLICAICSATSEILFLRGVKTGALLLGAMLLQPNVLIMGLMGVLATVVFARVTQLEKGYLERAPLLWLFRT